MAYSEIGGFPPQQLSYNRKKKAWRKKCVDRGLSTDELKDPHRQYSNHIFLVYLHINKINGKVYVGITHHVNPYKRWGYSGQKYTHCRKFLNAIKKYGWDNFIHLVICRTSKDRAITLERTLIAHYKRLNLSYNIADGGEGAEAISEETHEKLKEIKSKNPPMLGKHHTLEARKRISEAGKKRVYTKEQKIQLAKVAAKGRETMKKNGWESLIKAAKESAIKNSLPVLQLDLDGNVLREFPSTIVADKFCHGGRRQNHISDVCNGKRKTDAGFRWVYKKDYEKERRAI